MKAPRGGGKSKLLSALGFCLWIFKGRSGIDMGGALEQAKIVYNYFTNYCYCDDGISEQLLKDPTISITETKQGNYFKCVTASPKQVRGPHPDFLMVDEACEAKDALISDALPMVNTSQNPLIVLTSTFHKIFGIFQETWDKADELGYIRISWDIFDVVKTFDKAIWKDPKLNREIPDLQKLEELSQGKTGDPEGWIRIENVIQAWREKLTLDWFLVEYMGNRPSAAGLVLNPEDVDASIFDDKQPNQYNIIKGAERIIGVDWGFSSMTSVTDLMNWKDSVKILIENKNYSQVRSGIIIADIVEMVRKGGHRFIYADSAGKFENVDLQNALSKAELRCKVIEVVFGKEKDGMLGNLRAHFERVKMRIPKRLVEAKWQLKRYRYQEGTDKPVKKDDHIPDSLMCALQHWPLTKHVYRLKVVESNSDSDKAITDGVMDERF